RTAHFRSQELLVIDGPTWAAGTLIDVRSSHRRHLRMRIKRHGRDKGGVVSSYRAGRFAREAASSRIAGTAALRQGKRQGSANRLTRLANNLGPCDAGRVFLRRCNEPQGGRVNGGPAMAAVGEEGHSDRGRRSEARRKTQDWRGNVWLRRNLCGTDADALWRRIARVTLAASARKDSAQ